MTYDEELKSKLRYARKHISFQTICDGFTELLPILLMDKMKQMKQNVNNGNVIIFILVVMEYGIVLMEKMKLIVIHHHH